MLILFLAFFSFSDEESCNYEELEWPDSKVIYSKRFKNCYKFTGNIEIPETIGTISSEAFYNCWGFDDTLTIGQNVIEIYERAFYNCSQLKEIRIESIKLQSIGNSCFENCSSLRELKLPDCIITIGNLAFKDCSSLFISTDMPFSSLSSLSSIGESAFENCKSLSGSLEFNSACVNIGKRAFAFCTKLNGHLSLPDNLQTLEDSTFIGCSGLTGQLIIPSTVSKIGSNCFENCSKFVGSLTIPSKVTDIHQSAFANCFGFDGILSFNGATALKAIHNDAFFKCSHFTQLVFSTTSSITIGDRAFACCSSFTGDLILPDKISEIGKSAFENCTGFGKLTTSKSLKIVKERTFFGCSGFTGEFDFSSYSELCDYAFSGCKGFTGKLVLPRITYHNGVFSDCIGLTSVDLMSYKITTVNSYMFKGCSGLNKIIRLAPDSIVYDHAFDGCSKVPEINIDSISSFYSYAFAGCTSLKMHINLPSSIDAIPDGLFYNCQSIESVTLDDKITSIGENAFYNCKSLSGTLKLPNNIEKIGKSAFLGAGYSEVIYNSSVSPKECGKDAFSENSIRITVPDSYSSDEFCGINLKPDESSPTKVVPSFIPSATANINDNIDVKYVSPKLSKEAIIGISVGCAAFVAIIITTVVLVVKCKKRKIGVSNSN